LNDEINKLIREKGHWEKRIVQLGGPDYSLTRQKVTDSDGKEISAASGKGSGYRYFGAAKNLPGVKELFEKEGPRILRRSRYDMHKAIDADYYGFRDEDDGVLLKVEAEAERAIKRRVRLCLAAV
jgi:pre-mRNA-splicing factor ISY1